MRLRNIRLILICLLALPFVGIKAECTGWSVAIDKQDTALCSAQSLALSMIVHNDTASLDPSSEYRWYVQKPSASDYELLTETTISTTYLFDEVGSYSVKAAARPNECTIYHESLPISIELYPTLTAGTIGNSQTICYNSIPEALAQVSSPTGGNSEITFQWQESTDNGSSWNNITGEYGTSLTLPPLTQTTKYRILYTSCKAVDYSNEVTITVRTPATAPTITSYVTPLCYNQGTATLSVIQEAAGASDEIFTYQWQESLDDIEFLDISGATGTTFTTPTQTSATWYRVVATSSRGCGSVASSSVKVDVYPDWSISNTTIDPLCYMTGGEISVSATGAEDNYLYQWQESNDGLHWTNISLANTAQYSIPGKTAGGYYYRALVSPTTGCASKFSDIISVAVYDDLVAGVIIGVDTICTNDTPNLLQQTTAPTGGNNAFTYQWQYKSGEEWHNLSGATNTSYQPQALTSTTSYRLVATTACGSIASNEIEVYVRKPLTKPIITSTPETACYGLEPNVISIVTPATCDTHDSVLYQWQERGEGEWMDVPGANALTFQPSAITATHQYRVIAKSLKGCVSENSNVRTVNVFNPLAITPTGTAPLCYMTPGTIKVEATGSGENYTYQWQEWNGSAFVDIPSATNDTYITEPKVGGSYQYRCVVTPTNGCPQGISDIISVAVYDDLVAGVIVGIDTICTNETPNLLQQTTVPTGGNNIFTYQWQYKSGEEWNNISGATNTSYQPQALTSTTSYRLVATTACGSIASNEIEVYVRKPLTKPIITSSPETVCYNFAPQTIYVTTPSECDIYDSVLYQWQCKRVTDTEWVNIVGETSLSYSPKAITSPYQYRIVATSSRGCGVQESDPRTVYVYDDLQISTIGVSPLCYMNSGIIQVNATGEGESYTYQWQDSINGVWTDIVTEGNAQQYATQPNEGGTYYYRCIVTPTLGCTPDTSSVISVLVFDSVDPGSITLRGVDTICYGIAPDTISLNVQPIGGKGEYHYHWMQKSEDEANFSYILDAIDTTFYTPTTLYKTTEYMLEVTDSCGEPKYTNIVRVYVRNELHKPVLNKYNDTICYNTIPDSLTMQTKPWGGVDDSFIYQWEESEDGISYTAIEGETQEVYYPKALVKSHYYRILATSVKCGDILSSDAIQVNVYDSLKINAINPDTLCYMTATTISVIATGGGELYTYQWQDSTNGQWNDVPTKGNEQYYTTDSQPDGNHYYRCLVYAEKCEYYYRISPLITVSVYKAFDAGTIIGTDSTCYGFAPETPLKIDKEPSGVDGHYTYQWQIYENDIWQNIEGETTNEYQPNNLFNGTAYRLQVSSKCGILTTDSVYIRVNPLPELQSISGPDSVCYNQHEIYSIDKLNSGFTYEWMIENGDGVLTTEIFNAATIDILWLNPNTTDSVILHITNDQTGCESYMKYGVSICNEQAPERTIIVRKPNSNILVCKEDDENLLYQWGYTDKNTLQDFPIEDSNRRYVLLPHTFDNVAYDYWLTLRHSETSPCYSRSYYSIDNDTLITPSAANVSIPSYIRERIPITVENPNEAQIICALYTLAGDLIGRYNLGNAPYLSTTLPISVHSGMYVIHVSMGDYVKSIKLIAE